MTSLFLKLTKLHIIKLMGIDRKKCNNITEKVIIKACLADSNGTTDNTRNICSNCKYIFYIYYRVIFRLYCLPVYDKYYKQIYSYVFQLLSPKSLQNKSTFCIVLYMCLLRLLYLTKHFYCNQIKKYQKITLI